MNRQFQSGLTMIEILIAIFIMAVGLLGTATLQMRAVQDTGNSNLRSMAIYLANDMADRIRSNQVGREGGFLDDMSGAAAFAECMNTTGCSPEDMANHDKATWLENVQNILPGSDAWIERDENIYTVYIEWDERVKQSGASMDKGSITLTFEP